MNILLEISTIILLFLLNPLFLVALIVAMLLGYYRVKRERYHFRLRLYSGMTEFKRLLSESWMYGLALSILILGLVIIVDPGWLVLFCTASFLALISFNFKVTSPIYYVTAAFVSIFIIEYFHAEFFYEGWGSSGLSVTIPMIAGLMLIIEGALILRYASQDVSPFFRATKRGLHAVVFKAKRLWILPVLFLVPADLVTPIVPNWPQFQFGNTATLAFLPIPVVIGFSQITRSTYPEVLFPKLGRSIIILGSTVLVIGIGAFWIPLMGLGGLLLGTVGRAMLSIRISIGERQGKFAMAPQSEGVMIAGVLPNSPGEKMGLISGECIRTVNGQKVNNEKELYNALQINAKHCYLQVNDRNGEERTMQEVIDWEGYHLLGLLVV